MSKWTVSTVFEGLSNGLLTSWIHFEAAAAPTGFLSEKGDSDVGSIAVTLSYR